MVQIGQIVTRTTMCAIFWQEARKIVSYCQFKSWCSSLPKRKAHISQGCIAITTVPLCNALHSEHGIAQCAQCAMHDSAQMCALCMTLPAVHCNACVLALT